MIAAPPRSWAFRDTARLVDRLEATPWCKQGDVLSLVVGDLSEVEECRAGVEERVFALNADRRQPRIADAESGDSLHNALCRAFGFATDGTRSEREVLAAGLADTPLVLFVVEEQIDEFRRRREEASAMVELAGKVADRAGLLVVIVATDPAATTIEDTFDLTVGMPHTGVLAAGRDGELGLWNAYLMVRVAFEAGGSPFRAASIMAELRGVSAGDDHRLEDGLARAAEKLALDVGGDSRLFDYERERLTEAVAGRRAAAVDRQFERDGISWAPPGSPVACPAPWAARRLLALRPASEIRSSLRSALVCAPLAGELLAALLQIEALIRDRWSRDVEPSVQLKDLEWRTWVRCKNGERAMSYPEGHPARPFEDRDAVAFAGFGNIETTARSLNLVVPSWVPEVRETRNFLAHNHYVCFRHVRDTARFQDRLRRW